MPKASIKTRATNPLKESFIEPQQKPDSVLKTEYGKFFIAVIEDVVNRMSLPLAPVKAHAHTIWYLTQGSAEMTIDNIPYSIEKKECLVVRAGQVFSIDYIDLHNSKGYMVTFHNDMAIGKTVKGKPSSGFDFLAVKGNPKISFDNNAAIYILTLLRRIDDDYVDNGLKHLTLIQSYFTTLLSEIEKSYTPLATVKKIKKN